MSDKPELVGILFRPDGTCSYDGGKTWHDWTQGPGKLTVTRASDPTFRRVGYLDSSWDIMECSVCFALVSSEHEDEHTAWHRGHGGGNQ